METHKYTGDKPNPSEKSADDLFPTKQEETRVAIKPSEKADENWRSYMTDKFPILQYFKYDHLPEYLQAVSKPFADLAWQMMFEVGYSKAPAEVSAGLRKLLEAKDCLVRAALAK